MPSVDKIVEQMRANPRDVRFADALKVCEHYFGSPRIHGSHHLFATSWQGEPRINLQASGSKAKAYQVRQILLAIALMGDDREA